MRELTLYKINQKTPVFVLPPGSKKFVYHETSKKLAFTVLQELPCENYKLDRSYKVVNFNHWIVAVPKESIKLFAEA